MPWFSLIPALRRLRQEEQTFEAKLDYMARLKKAGVGVGGAIDFRVGLFVCLFFPRQSFSM